jgi:HPt (histidine-containing phosphotransfer) domain-containing protein
MLHFDMLSDMSDEFLAVATKEIDEDLTELGIIFTSCKNDRDVVSNADNFQKHTHKIKGLAPMMGKTSLGKISGSLDILLKTLLPSDEVDGIFDLLSEILPFMKSLMVEDTYDFSMIEEKISKIQNMSN